MDEHEKNSVTPYFFAFASVRVKNAKNYGYSPGYRNLLYWTGLFIIIFLVWHLGLHGYKMDISFLFTGIQIIDKKGQRHVF